MEMPVVQSEQQRPRQTLALNGSVAAVNEIQGSPLPTHGVGGGDSKHDETSGYPVPYLPEDIWRRIHFLMPMDAAARAACLSHAFLSSWRCYPKLTLNQYTLRSKASLENLRCRIDRILRNRSGIGLKMLRLSLCHEYSSSLPYVDNWLRIAVTPGIEELTLSLCENYNFPCSVLSDGVRSSIRSLQLDYCVFHPTLELGPLRSLTRLRLRHVRITGEALECLLSNSLALEHLELSNCKEINYLKVPSVLLQLSYLRVYGCWDLQVVENKAPSLSSFTLIGEVSKLSLGEASQIMKFLSLRRANVLCYARANLPSIMPNLETLELRSSDEVNTPMLPTKFLNLKHLTIQMCGATLAPSYDYGSLVSFLDASPSLETWYLDVSQKDMVHESVFGGSSHLRQLPERHHDCLKSVEIVGFSSAKSLVELTRCIVKSAVSLEQLKLDPLLGDERCSGGNDSDCRDQICCPISKALLEEASRAAAAIRKYIEDEVPPTVKLNVLELCPRCHTTTTDYDESVAAVNEIQGPPSPCHRIDCGDSKDGENGETLGYSTPYFPEDIWRRIHFLMPMDAAARAACLSRAFLSSWRCYPKLTLSRHMLCSKARRGNLSSRIDRILRNHSGIGLKMLRLNLCSEYSSVPYIDNWLHVAVTPGIEELSLSLHEKYKFPCSLLSDGVRSSIRSLQLDSCVFHPALELGPLRSLTRLRLRHVRVTGEELECLLSNSLALEHLVLNNCKEITFLKIPSVLLQLQLRECFRMLVSAGYRE